MALILRFFTEFDRFSGRWYHSGWRYTYTVRKILSPSSSLLPLAKSITHPAARSLCDSWASCFNNIHTHSQYSVLARLCFCLPDSQTSTPVVFKLFLVIASFNRSIKLSHRCSHCGWLFRCSEYTGKADSHTGGGRRHHSRGGQPSGGAYHPSTDVPSTTTASIGTADAAAAASGMAAGDDGSVSDSAMLFGPMTDDRRRHKTGSDAAGSKSSTTGAAASSKTGSGNTLLLLLTCLLIYNDVIGPPAWHAFLPC